MTTDAQILELLDAVDTLHVFDSENGDTPVVGSVYVGGLDVDEDEKVIDVPLPYLVFWPSPGYDSRERFNGRAGGRVSEFQLTGVGESTTQAKWVLDQARGALSRKRLGRGRIRRTPDNPLIRRDDDYSRPGGEPLYTGVDRYTLPT